MRPGDSGARLAPHVLLVNSDAASREIMRDALEHDGCIVEEALTGEDGLRMAHELRPDVIIGDFPMDVPGHSPFTQDVRGDPQLAGTRILAVTTRAMDHQLAAARAVADEVLIKPVEPSAVVRAVRRLAVGC